MKEILVTSSVLILCIMLIRLIFKGKISSRLQYALWFLVALRLVIPSSAQFRMAVGSIEKFRVMDLVESLEARVGNESELWNRPVRFTMSLDGGFGDMMAKWLIGTDLDESVIGRADGPTSVFFAGRVGVGWIDVFRMIWIGGVPVVAAWMLVTNFIFRRRLHKGRRELMLADGAGDVKIYVVDELASPCLYGVPGREAIYLTPDVAKNEKHMQHVLTHEMCHKKHGDSFWSILRAVLVTVYWVNPLVWAAAVLSKRDCELACDEAALAVLGEDERISYGETLLSIITKKSSLSDLACTATTMTGSGKSVKERIMFIAKKPRILGVAVAAALLLVLVVSVMVFTKSPRFSGGVWEEGDAVVISGELMVRLPETIAGIGGYHIDEDSGDILVYQVSSGKEAGRFRVVSFGEAAMLAEEGREMIPLGNYGQNSRLRQYMALLNGDVSAGPEEVTEHNYWAQDRIEHDYRINDVEDGIPTVNDDTTTIYTLKEPDLTEDGQNMGEASDQFETEELEDGRNMVQATDRFEANQPTEEQSGEGRSDDYQPTEASVEYLPNEEIISTRIPADDSSALCYVYVKADYDGVKDIDLDEMEYLNNELKAAADQAVVSSANRPVDDRTFTELAKNRTEYLGDASKVSALVNALPQPEGLVYAGVELQTGSDLEPTLDIFYDMTAKQWEDVDAACMHLNALMLFAVIENVEQCNFKINGSPVASKENSGGQDRNGNVPQGEETTADMARQDGMESIESISFVRGDLEKEWGELWIGEASGDENTITEQLKSLYARAAASLDKE